MDATFALLKHVKAWMDEHYHPDGYNVGWNCWAVGGQIAMHAHMHVMPRFRQEPYAGRGAKPADLPAEQPTRYYFTVSLKTATTLGLTIPPSLLLRADDVIQ